MTSFLVLLTRVSLLMATKLAAIGQDFLYNVSYSRKIFEGENFRGLDTLNIFAFWFPRNEVDLQKLIPSKISHYTAVQNSCGVESLNSLWHTCQPWYLYMQDKVTHFAGFSLLLQDNTS